MEGIRSSYAENNLGRSIYNQVVSCKPSLCVEIGVLDGYSSYYIASALRFLDQNGISNNGKLESYDLFDEYPYNHGEMKKVQDFLESKNLHGYFSLEKENAFEVYKRYSDSSVGLLHVDISNDGDVLSEMIDKWTSKIKFSGIILFEGGSKERDQIEWMKKYNKKPIKPEIESNKKLNENFFWRTIPMFPSITIMRKKTK